jgi:2',3'-cyclic-nucleotide 2'-phosphodiesterase (5'-nucleotidase family)
LYEGFIGPSHKKGIKMAEKAQRDGVDLLIGLTHIGLDKDTTLISHSRSIDMIFGGHSHTRLDQPKMVENLKGEIIPVFQTGAHGMAIGSLIVDVLGDGEYKLIDYRLYDVTKDIPEDTDVKKFVDEAYLNRERYFNRQWDEVIGFSEITLTGLYKGKVRDPRSCWSRHIARLTRTTAETDLSLQFDIFQGEEIPAGPIRFGDLIDNFPHFRAWGDKGWNISRAKVSGIILKQVLKTLSDGNIPFDATIDGVEAWDQSKNRRVPYVTGGVHKLEEALVNGESIENWKLYTLALPSEIPYALGRMLPALRNILLMQSQQVPDSDYWTLFEDYLAKNSPLKCLED